MLVKKKSPFAFGDFLMYIIGAVDICICTPSKEQAEMPVFYLKKTSILSGET